MRVEVVNGRKLLCGQILKPSQLAVGQTWASASGADRVVNITDIDGDWVRYEWAEDGKPASHEKDAFAFQCRYCLVIEEPQPQEN